MSSPGLPPRTVPPAPPGAPPASGAPPAPGTAPAVRGGVGTVLPARGPRRGTVTSRRGVHGGIVVSGATEDTVRRGLDAARARVREAMAGTPGLFRRYAVLCLVAALACGFTAAQAFRLRSDALATARADADQLVRLQAVYTDLVRADANATNAFLVGGLEPAGQREEYVDSLDRAARRVAEAARAQPADARALGVVNAELVSYAGLVEAARANNRQGFPVGAQYLRDAGQGLRTEAMPALDALLRANERRVNEAFDAAAWSWAWLMGGSGLAFAVLLWSMVWLARRTHRVLNVPLLAAGSVVLVCMVVGGALLVGVQSDTRRVRDGPYAASLAAAKARIAAFDAKSLESLTLIARGSGDDLEASWKTAAGEAGEQTGRLAGLERQASDLPDALEAWKDAHEKIRAEDDRGEWEAAVRLATRAGKGSANRAFDTFDERSLAVLERAGTRTSEGLEDPRALLAVAGLLALVLGPLAAGCAWWGFAQRLEEYR